MMAAGALSSLVLSRLGAGVGSLGLMMCTLAVAGTAVLPGLPDSIRRGLPEKVVGTRTTKKARPGGRAPWFSPVETIYATNGLNASFAKPA